MDCHFLLQGIFPTQGSNLHLLHCRWILYYCDIGEALLKISISNLQVDIRERGICVLQRGIREVMKTHVHFSSWWKDRNISMDISTTRLWVEGCPVKNYPLFPPRSSKEISSQHFISPRLRVEMTAAFRTIHFNTCLTSEETEGWLFGSLSTLWTPAPVTQTS